MIGERIMTENNCFEYRKKEWINCAKFFAILAVVVEHSKGILYTNQDLADATRYSVSLFILISGYLCFSSNERHNRTYKDTVVMSCKKIVWSWIFASFIYTIVACHWFDFQVFVNSLIYFNATGPFYYVLLYIQLMITSKMIYCLLISSKQYTKKRELACDIVLFFFLAFFAAVTTNNTNILYIYGGGGKLFGGSYLILFYIGMVINKYRLLYNNNKVEIIFIFIFSIICCVGWWRMMCVGYRTVIDSFFPFGEGVNPPSVTIMVFALLVFLCCYSFFSICSWYAGTNNITKVIGWVGQHTLYIFLYHRLWLDYFLKKYVNPDNIAIRRVIYITIMIAMPIAMEYLVLYIIKRIRCIISLTYNENN